MLSSANCLSSAADQPPSAGRSRASPRSGVRQHGGAVEPLGAGGAGREAALRHPDQEDGVPLEPLGAVHGEQLDRVRLGGRGDVEAGAVLVLGLEVGEQRGQRDGAVDGLELRDRLHEQVEVVAPGLGRRADRGGQLDVDAGGVDDPADQVEQRLAGVRPEVAQLPGEQGEPLAGLGGVVTLPRVLEGVAQGHHLGRVGPGDGGLELLGEVAEPLALARLGEPGEVPRPAAEQRQVAAADRPPRPGEQGEQLGVGGEVVEQRERGDDLGDLREAEQALEADDLHRDLGPGERVEHLGGVGVVAGQHADLAPGRRPHRLVGSDHLLGQPGRARRRSCRWTATRTVPSSACGGGSSSRTEVNWR